MSIDKVSKEICCPVFSVMTWLAALMCRALACIQLAALFLSKRAWQHATVNVFSPRCNYCELCVRGSRLLPMLDDMDVCMASTQKNYLFCGVQNDVLKWRANM